MIRPMEQADLFRVAEIHVFGWRSAYRGFIPDEYLFKNVNVTRSIELFGKILSTTESYVFDDGIVKALLTIGPCKDEDKQNSFELCAVYVDPFFKRQGIGGKMALFCEEKAKERGYKEICLWVFEKNVDSRLFYEKMGYAFDGTVKRHERHDTNVVRYVKTL